MTIEELENTGWIAMEAVVGSQSFGLATENSDVDTRGVFVLPMNERIAYGAIDQVADERNNRVFWEMGKFLGLLREGNPSALEFLNSPDECIRKGGYLFDVIPKDIWVTERCRKSFLEYAKNQLSRAYGLNKKIFNPQPEEPPRVLDYCYVVTREKPPVPFKRFLVQQPERFMREQKWYALASLDHVTDAYALYWQDPMSGTSGKEHEWRWAYGVVSDEAKANDIQLAPHIPQGLLPVATLFFNKNAYSHDCSEHTKYWHWVRERNESRYEETLKHGKGYDAKNTMHCIRLLMTAKELAETGKVRVDRSADREFLLGIKAGKYSYEEMMALSDKLVKETEEAFEKSRWLRPELGEGELSALLCRILRTMEPKYNMILDWSEDL